MERCTERSYGGYGLLKDGYSNQFALSKLATYEDTELEPSEILNLKTKVAVLQEELDMAKTEVQGLSKKLTFYQKLHSYIN